MRLKRCPAYPGSIVCQLSPAQTSNHARGFFLPTPESRKPRPRASGAGFLYNGRRSEGVGAPADGKGKRSSFAVPPSPVIIQANVHITQPRKFVRFK